MLGLDYRNRFLQFGNLDDLEKAIQLESRAVELAPNDHTEMPVRLANLGVSYTHRFRRLGKLDDLEKSISYHSRAVALTPGGHPEMPERLANLGVSYTHRFRRLDQLDDLDKSIAHCSRAVALTPTGHPDMPARLADSAASYSDRFRRLGDLADLDRSIEHRSLALTLTPDGHPDMHKRIAKLGSSYVDQFRRLGKLDALEKSIEHYSRAIELTPNNHPDIPERLGDLAVSYGERFWQLGDFGDFEKGMELESRALALTPDDHPDKPIRFNNLGIGFAQKFQLLGQLDDLEKAIEFESRAVELTPNGHPDMPARLTSLGTSYKDRFQRLGELDDLEKSVAHCSHAIELTPGGHPEMPRRLTNLGMCYTDRFRRLGELDDLAKSIEHCSRAVALTPDGQTSMQKRLTNLAVSYSDRFQHLGELADLEEVIKLESRALAFTPDGDPDMPTRLTNLGISYDTRFIRLRKLDDIDKSIELCSRALELTPDGHPDMPDRLSSLGVGYAHRFGQLGRLDDLDQAIEHHSRAVKLTPDGHADESIRHFNLAQSCLMHCQRTSSSSHLSNTLHSYRLASQLLTGGPRRAFINALVWAKQASEHRFLDPIEAFQATVNLLPQFIWLGATANQRYQDLSMAEGLAVNAANTAICSSNHLLALEWLEHARCVVWSQSLMLRSPLDQLHKAHPELAAHLQTVADELNTSSGAQAAETPGSDLIPPEQAGKKRRGLAQQYQDLLTQVRQLPGFEGFLQPTKANSLIRAARNGPIVVINCCSDRCDAIIVLPNQDDVHSIPLPKFSREKAQRARNEMGKSLGSKGLRERGIQIGRGRKQGDKFGAVLKLLWNGIVHPVLEFLGFTKHVPAGELPHITWCPTGAVSFLPLHAAGDYDQPNAKVFNYAVSSYTPTLTALLSSSPTPLNNGLRVLGIGQEVTSIPGYRLSRLPGTTKELDHIKQHTQGMNNIGFSELTDERATKAAVLDAMERHDWVHLACHAHQNVGDPTESGFLLHDGVLDLASINQRSFKNKGLAFLSACQTATGDAKLPDEAVHLASGMLMAGYASVIATMWSVKDEDAPLVADKVYSQLMKDGKVGNGEAGKALHYAVGELREKVGEKEFGRWVPYIHIGS